jgi:hypothetical protein
MTKPHISHMEAGLPGGTYDDLHLGAVVSLRCTAATLLGTCLYLPMRYAGSTVSRETEMSVQPRVQASGLRRDGWSALINLKHMRAPRSEAVTLRKDRCQPPSTGLSTGRAAGTNRIDDPVTSFCQHPQTSISLSRSHRCQSSALSLYLSFTPSLEFYGNIRHCRVVRIEENTRIFLSRSGFFAVDLHLLDLTAFTTSLNSALTLYARLLVTAAVHSARSHASCISGPRRQCCVYGMIRPIDPRALTLRTLKVVVFTRCFHPKTW